MIKFLVFLSCLFFVNLGLAQSRTYINNGRLLADSQLPQVMVIVGDWSILGGVCTGELVGPKIVLTAAHCCEAGNKNVRDQAKTKRFVTHPLYNKVKSPYYGYALPEIFTYENDICIIELENEVQGVTPFSLPTKNPVLNQNHLIVGAGQNNSKRRQFGFLKVVKYSEKGIQTQAEINYGRPGDSGGGLLAGAPGEAVQLLGITSVSTHMCGQEKGVIFAPKNSHRCSVKESNVPGEIFVAPRTTGFASLRNEGNVSFLRDYARDNKVEICGLTRDCEDVIFE